MDFHQVGESRFADQRHGVRQGNLRQVGHQLGQLRHFVELDTAVDAVINLNDRGDFGQWRDLRALSQAVDGCVDNIRAAFEARIECCRPHADVVVGVQADLGIGQQPFHFPDHVGVHVVDGHPVDIVQFDHVGARVHQLLAYFRQPLDGNPGGVLNETADFPMRPRFLSRIFNRADGTLDRLLDRDARAGHGFEQTHLVRGERKAQGRVIGAVIKVQIHFYLRQLRIENCRRMNQSFNDHARMPLFYLFHFLRIVVVHLEHADAGFDQLVGNQNHLVAPQRNTRKLAPFPKRDVAELQLLG